MQENKGQENALVTFGQKVCTMNLSSRTSAYVYCLFFFIMSVTSMVIGGYMVRMQDDEQIFKVRYEIDGNCTNNGVKECEYRIPMDREVIGPIYALYQLTHFVGSTRDFIQSKSLKQLKGKDISNKESLLCGSYRTNRQMEKYRSWNGTPLDPEALASPCGLQAYLFFQDEFTIDNLGFTNSYDQGIFQRAQQSEKKQWIDPTLPAFQVWMSESMSGNMVKFYGNYTNNLEIKTYTLRATIKTNYSAGIEKYFILMARRSGMQDSEVVGWISFGLGALSILVSIMIGARILWIEIEMHKQRMIFPQATGSSIELKKKNQSNQD